MWTVKLCSQPIRYGLSFFAANERKPYVPFNFVLTFKAQELSHTYAINIRDFIYAILNFWFYNYSFIPFLYLMQLCIMFYIPLTLNAWFNHVLYISECMIQSCFIPLNAWFNHAVYLWIHDSIMFYIPLIPWFPHVLDTSECTIQSCYRYLWMHDSLIF